ncbi:hypothetical protein ALC60_11269 [Trachymyrmex zeteki]|uniref:Histone-lysine N-methyltransferase SETMAR n=1 Tax=Mycetomoellerius zeteki TaxID=64791 RepID=A0A151WPN9_9HYME|nr:hypothetical protein ALC60_11269 [Trachymyrmex zeteki]
MAKIHELRFELIDHPPYSPDLAPSDFFLFPKLKVWLGGQKFSSNEVIASVDAYFAKQDAQYYLNGLKGWEHRWKIEFDRKITCFYVRLKTFQTIQVYILYIYVAYGESTLSKKNVYKWYKLFQEGRENVNDEPRSGRPSTSKTDENVQEVKEIVLKNRRITIREIVDDLNISFGSCQSILTDVLGMTRVSAKCTCAHVVTSE